MQGASSLLLLILLAVAGPSFAQTQLSAPRLAIGNEASSIELSWAAVDTANGYHLYFAPYPYLGPDTVEVLDMGSALSIAGALPEGAAYYIAIQAYNDSGSSDFSNVEYFSISEQHLSFASAAGSFNGLTLIAPTNSNNTYLIDDLGELKHEWQSDTAPRLSVYLLDNGHLLRTGEVETEFFPAAGKGGLIEELDWDGNLVWRFQYSDASKTLHHDIELLANGNILAISWEDRGDIWSEVIVEIEKTGDNSGEIVWRWDVFEHLQALGLDPDEATNEDWIHLNSIDYNHATGQILLSSRSHDRLWIINHEDGEIVATSSVSLSGQHNANWIDDYSASSNITLFDNGVGFSRALELDPSMSNILFSYGNADSEYFYSSRISSVQRLGNGNTLICSGVEGLVIEIDSSGNKLREYVSSYGASPRQDTGGNLFRAEKYATGYTPFF